MAPAFAAAPASSGGTRPTLPARVEAPPTRAVPGARARRPGTTADGRLGPIADRSARREGGHHTVDEPCGGVVLPEPVAQVGRQGGEVGRPEVAGRAGERGVEAEPGRLGGVRARRI